MTGSSDNPRAAQGPAGPGAYPEEIELLKYWGILVKRRMVVFVCLLGVVAVAMILTFLTTPRYQATSTLEIQRKAPDILEYTDVVGVDAAGYKDFYQTQYQLLRSRKVVEIAAASLDLTHRPEFAQLQGSPIERLVAWGKGLVVGQPESSTEVDPAIGYITTRVSVTPVRNSHLVQVSATDRDPVLAADISNALADAYRQFQMDVRYNTTGQAKEFLAKDVLRVQSDLAELEHQLQAYAGEKRIFSFSGGTQDISEQALADINRRYVEAKGRFATTEAHYRAVHQAPADGLSEVLESPVLRHLRQQRSELERRHSQMSERFQPDWPPLRELEEELSESRLQIKRESEAIATRVRSVAMADFEQARLEVEQFQQQQETQKGEVQRVNIDAIQYDSLSADIETKRRVLNDLVERQSETETSFRLRESNTSNIRVVDRASPPLIASYPRKKLNFVFAVFVGLALGCGAAIVLDRLDNTVKTEQDVWNIGHLPVLGHVPLTRSLAVVDERTSVSENLTPKLDIASHLEPRSSFSETFRNLRTSLLLATPDHPPRYVAVTSCEPEDGKSTVAMNLAIVLTQAGRRVLLVDADLRRPRLHKTLGLNNSVGLSSLLSGNSTLDELIQETEIPNMRAISSGPIPPNPSELLGSPGLQSLLEQATAGGFDHIILDSPPLLSVTDSTVLASRVDSTILVVRAGVTSREALAQSASQLRQSRAQVVGAVLNAVSEDTGYYYGRYGRYYNQKPDDDSPRKPDRAAKRASGRRHAG